jgi:hypothetical protein
VLPANGEGVSPTYVRSYRLPEVSAPTPSSEFGRTRLDGHPLRRAITRRLRRSDIFGLGRALAGELERASGIGAASDSFRVCSRSKFLACRHRGDTRFLSGFLQYGRSAETSRPRKRLLSSENGDFAGLGSGVGQVFTSEVLYQLSYVGESVADRIGPSSLSRPAFGAGLPARTGRARRHCSTCHHGTASRSTIPTAANSATPISASTKTVAKTSAVAA